MKCLRAGGMPDHIHVAIGLPTTMTVSEAAKLIKGASSTWIKDAFPRMCGFAWQDGYGAFTVSRSNLDEVVCYIENNGNITALKHFRKNTGHSWTGTKSNTKKNICGINCLRFKRRYATQLHGNA
jgi:putative transposase